MRYCAIGVFKIDLPIYSVHPRNGFFQRLPQHVGGSAVRSEPLIKDLHERCSRNVVQVGYPHPPSSHNLEEALAEVVFQGSLPNLEYSKSCERYYQKIRLEVTQWCFPNGGCNTLTVLPSEANRELKNCTRGATEIRFKWVASTPELAYSTLI